MTWPMKVIWEKNNLVLVSGFSISREKDETRSWIDIINEQIAKQ